MIAILIALVLIFIGLFIKVKIDANFFNGQSDDFWVISIVFTILLGEYYSSIDDMICKISLKFNIPDSYIQMGNTS